jgi:hypothetical protein
MREVTISRTSNYRRVVAMHVAWCAAGVSGKPGKIKIMLHFDQPVV